MHELGGARPWIAALAVVMALVAAPRVAEANHAPTTIGAPAGLPGDVPALRFGEWRFLANLPAGPGPTGPLGIDWGSFTRDGRRYVVFSSVTVGFTVVDVTEPTRPVRVSDYASSFGCPTSSAESMPEQQRPANPLGAWENDLDITPDGRFVLLGTDELGFRASGRCHDPGGGGVEIVDLTDVRRPRTLHLTRDVGQAHSITVDPGNPGLAYTSTSDGNDFIEIVDFRTCLGGVAALAECRPRVARAVFSTKWMPGIPTRADNPEADLIGDGCHDIRFRGDRAYCAAIDATLILDTSVVLDAQGTLNGTDLTRAGEHSCVLRDAPALRAPGVKVTDCFGWTEQAFESRGAQAVPIRVVGAVLHDGSKPPREDVEIAHQAEAIEGGRIMIVTDERGGGLNFGANVCPGGGISFYDIRDEGHPTLMRTPDGRPAIFITDRVFQTHGNCTVHYGTEFGDERLLVFAWYTQGTHVIRYTPDYSTVPATVAFDEVGVYVPAGASTWTSKGLVRNPANPDELIIYTTDINRGMDALAVRVPRTGAPAAAAGGPGPEPPAPAGGGATVASGRAEPGPLPATGLEGAGGLGLALLATAAALAAVRRSRERRVGRR